MAPSQSLKQSSFSITNVLAQSEFIIDEMIKKAGLLMLKKLPNLKNGTTRDQNHQHCYPLFEHNQIYLPRFILCKSTWSSLSETTDYSTTISQQIHQDSQQVLALKYHNLRIYIDAIHDTLEKRTSIGSPNNAS